MKQIFTHWSFCEKSLEGLEGAGTLWDVKLESNCYEKVIKINTTALIEDDYLKIRDIREAEDEKENFEKLRIVKGNREPSSLKEDDDDEGIKGRDQTKIPALWPKRSDTKIVEERMAEESKTVVEKMERRIH